jgi:predicted nucleotidyltransferase component of viral defense system
MAEIKRVNEAKIRNLVGSTGFDTALLTKDYYVTAILYLLKDVKGMYFKGGTALQKIFLEYSRLSEDVDYTCTRKISVLRREIKDIILQSGLFDKVMKDKDVDGFLRLVVHYKDLAGKDDAVFIDLNERGKLCEKPETHKIHHFYLGDMPEFSVTTLSQDEMVAEKMAATMGRNKPRDHFDLYRMLEMGMKVNLDLVKKKCRQSGYEFSILRMFNNAKKLKNRWDTDMMPLLSEEVPFEQVIRLLAKAFNLKEAKEKK